MMWDPETEAKNRRREIQIALALIQEATKVDDPQVVRRLNLAALMHLENSQPAAQHAAA